jgi:GNAT superfamily N-acetyltransferase
MTAEELLAVQCARLAALDPELPKRYLLPRGEPLMARLPSGEPVAGLVTHISSPPGSMSSLWSAAETLELFPLLGNQPGAGMDALLRAWREQLSARGASTTDSACLVTWPSRDVQATRALLDHGFQPLSCVAVRPPSPGAFTERPGTVKIRRAEPADLDAVVELMLAELGYAALVGGSVVRPDAARLKRTAAQVRLHSHDPVWLAERDAAPIALAECGWVDTEHHAAGQRLRPGRWGYINCLSVHETARGTGAGRELMALAHDEISRAGVLGSFLHYNPANPLSSVFWPRQGYRPLWTMWEVRPATALR